MWILLASWSTRCEFSAGFFLFLLNYVMCVLREEVILSVRFAAYDEISDVGFDPLSSTRTIYLLIMSVFFLFFKVEGNWFGKPEAMVNLISITSRLA